MAVHRYQAIANALRDRILSGEWPIGHRLPAITALKDEFGVSGLNTVRAAQRVLQDEGLILARQGSGVYVISSGPSWGLSAELASIRDRLTAILSTLPRYLGDAPAGEREHRQILIEALRRYVDGSPPAAESAGLVEAARHLLERVERPG